MRRLPVFAATAVAAALVGACAYTDAAPVRTPQAAQELDHYLAGRVAGQPQSCLPNYRANDMVVIDERTVLFREGSNRIWRTDIRGGCNGLGRPGNAMVTRQYGAGLCSGEIVHVVDTQAGFTVGSCSLGEFVPYTLPNRR